MDKKFLYFAIGIILFVVIASNFIKIEGYNDVQPRNNPNELINDMKDYLRTNDSLNVFKPESVFDVKDSTDINKQFKPLQVINYTPTEHGLPPFDQLSRDFIAVRNLDLNKKPETGLDPETGRKYYKERVNNNEVILNVDNLYNNDYIMNGGKFMGNVVGYDDVDSEYVAFNN